MNIKQVKLVQKKSGSGGLSYTINISHSEAVSLGLVNDDNSTNPVVKILDEKNRQLIIKKQS